MERSVKFFDESSEVVWKHPAELTLFGNQCHTRRGVWWAYLNMCRYTDLPATATHAMAVPLTWVYQRHLIGEHKYYKKKKKKKITRHWKISRP